MFLCVFLCVFLSACECGGGQEESSVCFCVCFCASFCQSGLASGFPPPSSSLRHKQIHSQHKGAASLPPIIRTVELRIEMLGGQSYVTAFLHKALAFS